MSTDLKTKGSSAWLAFIIVVACTGLAFFFLKTGPEVLPDEEISVAKMVKIREVTPDRYPIFVSAYGSVVPAQRVTIEPEVTGLVIRQHPQLTLGGQIMKGDELFVINPKLAELALEESQSSVKRAQVNLTEAKRKFAEAKRLASNALIPDSELASLEAEALVQEAEVARLTVAMKRNEEMLRRHRLTAPFNAIVLEENLEIGQRIDPGFSAATLIGSDELWVQVSLPVDQIRHIRFPEKSQQGASASIFLTSGGQKQFVGNGKVIGLRGDLEREGRMARLLISFPYYGKDANKPHDTPLLIGSYVRVDIEAGEIDNCLAINQASLRTGDRIWVVDQAKTIQIKEVEVYWTMDDMVYVSNVIKPGETLIVSPLRSAVPGTPVNPQPATEP